ncbi:MAG TPA: NAD-dependent epimerase/dehydratase family protein [Jiangellaceae bacterium]
MKVLVTGATGNIGTSVMQTLNADPSVDDLVGLARRLPAWLPDRAHFVRADISSADLVSLFRNIDVVVHLAWAFQPTHRPITTWEVNVLGSARVFEAAATAGVRSLIYASSVGAYSPGPGRQVDETWPTHSLPTAGYGREKAYLERYLDAFEFRNPSMRIVRLRPCFVFKRQSASEQRRIFAGPLLPRMLVRPGRLPVVPVPAGLRFQAVHADDVAEAFRLAVLGELSGAFNLAADPIIDRERLAEVFGSRIVPLPGAVLRAGLAAAWRLRVVPTEDALLQLLLNLPTLYATKARQELGWAPRHSGVDAIREVLHGVADGAGFPTPPLKPDRPESRAQ